MGRKKGWTFSEKHILKENYNDKTIKELEVMLPGRSREGINNKIKRLKSKKEIPEGKSKIAIKRSYSQRGKNTITSWIFNPDTSTWSKR
jgi:hypothetical protein